jgi:hypothetical protein
VVCPRTDRNLLHRLRRLLRRRRDLARVLLQAGSAGKNVWLLAQLACIVCYFVGAILVRRRAIRMMLPIVTSGKD